MLQTNKCAEKQGSERSSSLEPSVRGAMYVRSATVDQAALNRQTTAIESYVDRNNLQIVKRYAECGKPGRARDEMMNAVQNGKADFAVILMENITRWGRFPDADDSLYHEYLCKRAGIDVRYVQQESFKTEVNPPIGLIEGLRHVLKR